MSDYKRNDIWNKYVLSSHLNESTDGALAMLTGVHVALNSAIKKSATLFGCHSADAVPPAMTQSSSSSMWSSISGANSRNGSLTAPSMNGVSRWIASFGNKKDTLNTYCEWNSKDWCALSKFTVHTTVVILNVFTRALNSSLRHFSVHKQNASGVWLRPHICVIFIGILTNVAANGRPNLTV